MKITKLPLLIAVSFLTLLTGCNNTQPSNQTSTSEPTSSFNDETNVNKLEGKSLTNDDINIIKWEGRYEYREEKNSLPSMMLIYHTATGFTLDFYGTEVSATFYHAKDLNNTLACNIYYDVKVDDEVLPNVLNRKIKLPKEETKSTVKLVGGLQEGRHTITVLKMNEAKDAYTGVIDITTDGHFYQRDVQQDNSRLKFMAVNASSGSGFGALAYSTTSAYEFSKTNENSSSLHAYMYLTARRFDADISFVATSGWGVKYPNNRSVIDIVDYTGVTPTNSSKDAQKDTAKWDHSLYTPDVIMFHIGGNDTSVDGFDVDTYKEGVITLVTMLHERYPSAKMLWAHTDSKGGRYAITALKDEGIISQGYIKQCIMPGVGEGTTGHGTYGASNHQSLKTHIDSSESLTNTLSRWDFTPVRDQIKFEDFESILQK